MKIDPRFVLIWTLILLLLVMSFLIVMVKY